MRSKRQNQIDHAARRMEERFGIKLTQFVRDEILHKINMCRRGGWVRGCSLFKKQSLRVLIYDVEMCEAEMRIVYDSYRGTIASVLTRDMDCELDL